MERNFAVSKQTHSYFTRFLWWLSTAEEELLADAVVDRNRYSIIGMTVMATWLFASFAWTYFFSTIVDSISIALLCGLFMGFVILTIDRALIKGITKFNKRKFTPLLFRGLLALTIGTFMAQPAVLYMFDKEIQQQTSIDNAEKKISKRQQLDSLNKSQRTELLQQKALSRKLIADKDASVSAARANFLSETDGSGGSGKVGIQAIALAKKAEYEKLDAEYKLLATQEQVKMDSADAALQRQELSIRQEEKAFEAYLNNGFLTRINALSNLIKNNPPLQYRYYLIIFILTLIELMPVIAKTMLPSGTYDEKARLQEEMEIDLANSSILRTKATKERFSEAAFKQDTELIDRFLLDTKEERLEKMRKWSS